jgi:hypothetical protein
MKIRIINNHSDNRIVFVPGSRKPIRLPAFGQAVIAVSSSDAESMKRHLSQNDPGIRVESIPVVMTTANPDPIPEPVEAETPLPEIIGPFPDLDPIPVPDLPITPAEQIPEPVVQEQKPVKPKKTATTKTRGKKKK